MPPALARRIRRMWATGSSYGRIARALNMTVAAVVNFIASDEARAFPH